MTRKTVAYLRVSTLEQDLKNQKYEILNFADKNNLKVDEWMEIKISSRRSPKERLINELLAKLYEGDTIIVSELSRLGRSVGQIVIIASTLVDTGVRLISIKEGMKLDGTPDIQTKVMLTMFSLFAEIERDLVSARTKAGLAKARAEGKLIGRPKGLGKSRLDGKKEEIRELLRKGVSIASISKIYECSWPCVKHFAKTRKLNSPMQ